MFKRWLPKTGAFFEFFEQHSHLSKEACAELHALATNPDGLESRVKRIKEIEHRADEIAHLCIDTLHNTFITPIDRSDIHRLIRRLDDIIDAVDSVAARMLMYRMTEIRPEMRDLTQTLVEAVDEIAQAIEDLPFLNKRADSIQESCWEVYEAESRGDAHLRTALVSLFDTQTDPMVVIKWKEIFEGLERATDRCQEAAHIISGIVIEAS